LSTPDFNWGIAATNYIFPNPASTTFRIKFDHTISGPAVISVYDISGKEVSKTSLVAEDMISSEIPVNNLAKGVYVVKVSSADNKVQNFKFVKK